MDITQELPGDKPFIKAVSRDGITIRGETHSRSLIVSSKTVKTDWEVNRFEDFSRRTLEPLLELEPEVVIIGTGKSQRFLPPELMMLFYEGNVGIEVMSTPAACRTFNVLVLEERRVVAALLPPDGE